MIDPSPQTVPFHVVDPFDHLGWRCVEPHCSRRDRHPGPHRSVTGEGSTILSNTFWCALVVVAALTTACSGTSTLRHKADGSCEHREVTRLFGIPFISITNSGDCPEAAKR